MKTVDLKNGLIAVAISLAMVSCGGNNAKQQNVENSEQQNVESNEQETNEQISSNEDFTDNEILSSQEVKEMYPKFGKSFNDKDAAEFQKMIDVLDNVEWDYDKLTAKQKETIEKLGIDETFRSYWDAIGEGDGWYNSGGPNRVLASSYLKSNNAKITYLPENAHDLSFETAWVEGVKGHGIGEYLTYYFSLNSPRITKIIIATGYVKSEKAFRDNSRVKKLKMYIDDKPFAILNLEDRRCEQIFEFPPIGKHSTKDNDKSEWTMKFEILEVYPGDKDDDTAISEIYFNGLDVLCFAAGTKILMSDNSLKNIELIKEGDIVKSYDFQNKKLIDSKVKKLISVTHSNLVKLKFADNEIVTTADHPFWSEKNVWAAIDAEKANKNYTQKTKVSNLKVGDKIFNPQKNTFSAITDIKNISERQMTYTIELAENDNFIANGMLVKMEIEK